MLSCKHLCLGIIIAAGAALSGCAASSNPRLPPDFETAAKIGRAQEASAALTPYRKQQLMRVLGPVLAQTFRYCFDHVEEPDSAAFSFVQAIDGAGHVMKIYSDHETNIYRCMRDKIDGIRLPPPPVVPFFSLIEMRFTADPLSMGPLS